ncbi:sugar phosphate isomerase/epimerase family protein [Novipirellula artificiosorum]|uniref:Inosose dehydratase n=1 Tax=Novipirellula artificiosorum TaxID=2528016 RepID=A0A5C6DVX5_9BACT|nr:sugar phosphate isomerase/epimerase [Novipirellula artificiosorum]TWU39206.1 Inosose dehydratase [Novipirellula artificiosorum]
MKMRTSSKPSLNRRHLLQASVACAAGMAIGQRFATAAESVAEPGIALQLYSIRDDCAKDFDAALAWCAETGFDAVEFAGYHSYSGKADALKKRLDQLGLKVAATHIGTATLIGDALTQTIDFHQAIGCKYLVVPGDGRFSKPDGSKELAEIFNVAAENLKPHGMKCGYHNHTHEFEKEGDKTYWELFAERTVKDVVLQQDVGWTTAAHVDPVKMIRQYPGRSQVIHCKPTVVDGQGKAILGQDTVKWEPIFEACLEVGDTEWYTVEQERYPDGKSPMECTALSLAGLKKILGRS